MGERPGAISITEGMTHVCRSYRTRLTPGQYRAVFGLHGSREFFSWEFVLE